MMNKFNFNRFGKVVSRDFRSAVSLYGTLMMCFMLLPLGFWMCGIAFHPLDSSVQTSPEFRITLIRFMSLLAAVLAPMRIYKNCNMRGTGNYFALLPATLGEKFWSMLLYCCVLVPLAVFCGSCVVDTLLTALPFGPYVQPLWKADSYMLYGEFFGIHASTILLHVLGMLTSLFAAVSVFMLTNTIFKKNKFIRTLLWLMLIAFVLFLIGMPLMVHNADALVEWARNAAFHDWSERKIFNFIYWTGETFDLVVMTACLLITYFRLKKMQY